MSIDDLPNIDAGALDLPSLERLAPPAPATHAPRILLLYGSVRERSYSRFLTLEAERLLKHFGAETRVFDPRGMPQPDGVPADHPKVVELRALSTWSEGQVWCSPERHGAMTGILKSQIDWLPLNIGAVRPTQGRTLAVMQVSGGSQSFNAVNAMRILGRWMRMFTIPNQSSVPKAFEQFDEAGRMLPSSFYDRVVDGAAVTVFSKPKARDGAGDRAVVIVVLVGVFSLSAFSAARARRRPSGAGPRRPAARGAGGRAPAASTSGCSRRRRRLCRRRRGRRCR
jgi:arsenic resistance protein ArsH